MSTPALVRRLGAEVGRLVESRRREESAADHSRFRDDPIGFIRKVLHGEPWEGQERIALRFADSVLLTVQSCNGAGKDWLAARLALWWVFARGGFAILTGPSERQVREILMGEVRRAFHRAESLSGDLFELALRVDREGQQGILAFTSNHADRLTGFHAPALAVILTEAQGVEAFAYEAALACATGEESRILAVGNPLQPTGPFYKACRSKRWETIALSAFEHPNLIEDREVIPGAVTRSFVETIRREYGEASPVYQSRVLGRFPEDADVALCHRAWINAANDRWHEAHSRGDPEGAAYAALDPARFGADETALAIRRGPVLTELIAWHGSSTMETTGRVQVELAERHIDLRAGGWGAPPVLTVDESGLGGGVVDRLEELGVGVDAFNGGSAASSDRFLNARSESYWHLRALLERGSIALPPDEQLAEELTTMRWHVNSAGRIQLEAKEGLKDRMGRSPDRADAVAMAFWSYGRPRLGLEPISSSAHYNLG